MENQLNTQTKILWPIFTRFSPFLKQPVPKIVQSITIYFPAPVALAINNKPRVKPQSQDQSEDTNEY
jgi:hypothetical protein